MSKQSSATSASSTGTASLESPRAIRRLRAVCGFAIFASAFVFCPASRAAIEIDPVSWGLSAGDTFRLVMVTNGTTTATSANIATYDTFVNSQGLSGIRYQGSSFSWQAIGRTPASSPISDITRFSASANSIRTFNLAGIQVSNTTTANSFWRTSGSNAHLAAIDRTIDGSGNLAQINSSQLAWTGFDYNGAASTARNYNNSGGQIGTVSASLGSTASYQGYNPGTSTPIPNQTLYPWVGRIGASANGWAAVNSTSTLSTSYRMYAISDVITVSSVPESSMTAILVSSLVGILAVFRFRRRRHAAAASASF